MKNSIFIFLIFFSISCSKFAEKRIVSINTESALAHPDSKYNYGNLIDSTPEPWCEGVKGSGIGENLTFMFEAPVKFDTFYIINGINDKDQFGFYNRIKSFKLSLNHKESIIIPIEDSRFIQKIKLGRIFSGLLFNLKIHEVYQGTKFDATCISEIAFWPVKILKKKQSSKLNKPLSFAGSGYSFIILSDGKLDGKGQGNLACKMPFLKGWWNFTSQGLIFINAVLDPPSDCKKLDEKILSHPYLGLVTPLLPPQKN